MEVITKDANKNIYIHDDIVRGISFCLDERILIINATKQDSSMNYVIVCNGVCGIKATSCNFWGPCNCFSNMRYCSENEKELLNELIAIQKERNPSCQDDDLTDPDKLIEIVFDFISGDDIHVVCEKVIFEIDTQGNVGEDG